MRLLDGWWIGRDADREPSAVCHRTCTHSVLACQGTDVAGGNGGRIGERSQSAPTYSGMHSIKAADSEPTPNSGDPTLRYLQVRSTMCITCGVTWRGPGESQGRGRAARSAQVIVPLIVRQGRARSARQVHATVGRLVDQSGRRPRTVGRLPSHLYAQCCGLPGH
jgi:hypothetical protein